MSYYGDINLGDTIDIKFTTVNTSGVPTTLAGTPVISAYIDNDTTELTAGITLSVDFDSRTGMHNVRVVATSGNGYATATNVMLVITTGTVSSNSVVGYVVGSFSIEKRSALRPATAGRTIVVDASGNISFVTGLKKNTAFSNLHFVMLDDTNHVPTAGASATVQRLLDNGSWVTTGLSNIQDLGNGLYSVDGTTAVVNGGFVSFRATASGFDTTVWTIIITG